MKIYKLLGPDGKPYESTTPGTLGGHRGSKGYGRLDCPIALQWIAKGYYVKHRVFFADEATAIAAGYRPCAVCMKKRYTVWKQAQALAQGKREQALAIYQALLQAEDARSDAQAYTSEIAREHISPRLILILGGARSGKSSFAERLATTSGRRVAFIATATASDDEMRVRINSHRTSRPATWITIEEPLDLTKAVQQAAQVADVLLLDCMTLWLSNWLWRNGEVNFDEDATASTHYSTEALAEVEQLVTVTGELTIGKSLIVVSNEVGLGIVPEYAASRAYRDILGRVNQFLAQHADRVYLMMAGLAVDIKRLHEGTSL